MPLRAQSWQVSPGDLDLIAMPLVLPWYPAKDERLAVSLFRLRDVGRLEAVSKALRRAVKYHDLSFKALPELAEEEARRRWASPRHIAYVLVKNTLARVLRGIALRYNPELARITGQLQEYYRQRRPLRDIEPLELQQVQHMGRVLDEVDRLLEEIEAPDD